MHKEFRGRVSIVIVILCCSAAVTRSQDINEASAGARSLGPLPVQLIPTREHLLGNRYDSVFFLSAKILQNLDAKKLENIGKEKHSEWMNQHAEPELV